MAGFEAMVFAAGKGTRLGAMSLTRPKALVEVGGRPMLGRVLERLADAGAVQATVNVHWLAPQVKAWLADTQLPLPVAIQDESALLLDTGGTLRRWRFEHPGGELPLMVHNCDVLSDIPLQAMAAAHAASGADVTLCCHRRPTSRALQFGPSGRLTGRATGLDAEGALAFDGIHMLSARALDALLGYAPALTPFSITDFYAALAGDLDIRAWTPGQPFTWIDIGRPDTLDKARALVGGECRKNQ